MLYQVPVTCLQLRATVNPRHIPFFVLAKQVMISNLDYTLTEKDVEDFCSTAGAVAGVKLVKKWYAKTSKG